MDIFIKANKKKKDQRSFLFTKHHIILVVNYVKLLQFMEHGFILYFIFSVPKVSKIIKLLI